MPESKKSGSKSKNIWGVWFGGRNTPVVVGASSRSSAISKARQNKKRGGNDVVSAKRLSSSDASKARSGQWITTRSDGKSKATSSLGKGRGQGPPRKKKK